MTKMKNFNHEGEKGAQRFFFQSLLSPSFVRLFRLRGLFLLKFLVILRSFRIKKLNDAALPPTSDLLTTPQKQAILIYESPMFNALSGTPSPSVNYPPAKSFNRELSWIDFNERVLEEGLRNDLLPLDRLKFLSITVRNFDEFFMVRVAAVKRALRAGGAGTIENSELLSRIYRKVRSVCSRLDSCMAGEILPALARGGLEFPESRTWTPSQRFRLENFFRREILPLLTPLRFEPEGPLPAIGSGSIHAAFLLRPESPRVGVIPGTGAETTGIPGSPGTGFIAIVCIPRTIERIIQIPRAEGPGESTPGEGAWVFLEDLILQWGSHLFPGFEIEERMLFQVNRDADVSVDEKRDEDFVEAMEEVLEDRGFSSPVRMVYSAGSARLRDETARRFGLGEEDLYEVGFPLNLGQFYDAVIARGFDHLREKPWRIYPHPAFRGDESIFDRISQGDQILHLPYQSFEPVLRFFQEAAADPQVLCIKTALYRISGEHGSARLVPAIIRALEQASLAGKQVTAVVELKARFDEEQNISWANRLEKAGVIVVYGLARLKVHAKISLVMRREHERIRRYVHLSTGNYNDATAKVYEDIGLFSAREDLAYDAGLLFNLITGYSQALAMRRLVIAPTGLKQRLLELIERETRRSRPEAPGRIMAKLNALADGEIIDALYRASAAGVQIRLNVRGICLLVPGIPGLSEHISVVSIVDHNLEHARIYSFGPPGTEEIYLSSADWMPRNLERRVELMFPVLSAETRDQVRDILGTYFRDNSQAWRLQSDGRWTRLRPGPGEQPCRAQGELLALAAQEAERLESAEPEFIVRRSAI